MIKKKKSDKSPSTDITARTDYDTVLVGVVDLLEVARRASARSVNSIMTITYWEIGRRIVESEQNGAERAKYGEQLITQLAADLTKRFGRGFSKRSLEQMRLFYQLWPIAQTLSAQFGPSEPGQTFRAGLPQHERAKVSGPTERKTPSSEQEVSSAAPCFSLPWSHYVQLMSIHELTARQFYETEALRGGWSVRQLKRQIDSQFYQRTLLSKNKALMLRKGSVPHSDDRVTPEEELKDPLVLEFLDLKDEYSEHDLEEALIHKLEDFLLELGSDFAFISRQRRLRIGNQWFRVDLLFFHRRLKCLVVIDLKIGTFTHADAGQMHMYVNYAAEHWTHTDENPPVGLILCATNDMAVARYALDGLPTKVMAAEYKLALPDEKLLVAELQKTQRALEARTPKNSSNAVKQQLQEPEQ